MVLRVGPTFSTFIGVLKNADMSDATSVYIIDIGNMVFCILDFREDAIYIGTNKRFGLNEKSFIAAAKSNRKFHICKYIVFGKN